MNQKGFSIVQILLIVFAIAVLTGGGYFLGKNSQSKDTKQDQKIANIIQVASPSANPMVNSTFEPVQEVKKFSPTPTPKPEIEIQNYTYINNHKGFSFKYSPTLVLNSISTADFAQFLEYQQGMGRVARMIVQVYENPQNKTLEQMAEEKGSTKWGEIGLNQEKLTIDGHEALRFAKVLTQKELCNIDDGTSKNRIFSIFIKGNGFVVHIGPNNSCESFTRDWFDVTPQTFRFL
jgi:hypothetical protein